MTPSASRVLASRTCSAEWMRWCTVRATWWFLAAATLVLVGLGTLLGFESAADPVEIQGEPAWTTARFIAMPAQFALIGLVIVSVTSDYATGGIVPTLLWTPRRSVLFTARVLVTTTLATVAGLLLTVAAALAAKSTAGSALTLTADDGLGMAGRVGFVFLAGTALAAGLGFLVRSTAGALISAFLLLLVLPLLLPVFGDWLGRGARGLPGSGAVFLLTDGGEGMTLTSSVIVMTAWAVGVLVLAWLRLVQTDATAG